MKYPVETVSLHGPLSHEISLAHTQRRGVLTRAQAGSSAAGNPSHVCHAPKSPVRHADSESPSDQNTWGCPGGSDGTESACMQETWVPSLGQEDLLEEEMATHSSILAWRIPWTEEPGGLQPMGLLESDMTDQ